MIEQERQHERMRAPMADPLLVCSRCRVLYPEDEVCRRNDTPVCLDCMSSLELECLIDDMCERLEQR
jgi:hypothetical protein